MAWDGRGPSLPGRELRAVCWYRAGGAGSRASAASAPRTWLRLHGCRASANTLLTRRGSRPSAPTRQALYLVPSSLPLLCAQPGGYLSFRGPLPRLFVAFERPPGPLPLSLSLGEPPPPRASGKPWLGWGAAGQRGRGSTLAFDESPLWNLPPPTQPRGPHIWGLLGREPVGPPPACPRVLTHCCATNLYCQASG